MSAPAADPAVENPHAGQGSVLLDIGGDVGAVVVAMPEGAPVAATGVEVEARRHGLTGHVHHPHVAVVRRPTPDGELPSLVFGSLREGRYDLCLKESDEVQRSVDVRGGEVTFVSWDG